MVECLNNWSHSVQSICQWSVTVWLNKIGTNNGGSRMTWVPCEWPSISLFSAISVRNILNYSTNLFCMWALISFFTAKHADPQIDYMRRRRFLIVGAPPSTIYFCVSNCFVIFHVLHYFAKMFALVRNWNMLVCQQTICANGRAAEFYFKRVNF